MKGGYESYGEASARQMNFENRERRSEPNPDRAYERKQDMEIGQDK